MEWKAVSTSGNWRVEDQCGDYSLFYGDRLVWNDSDNNLLQAMAESIDGLIGDIIAEHQGQPVAPAPAAQTVEAIQVDEVEEVTYDSLHGEFLDAQSRLEDYCDANGLDFNGRPLACNDDEDWDFPDDEGEDFADDEAETVLAGSAQPVPEVTSRPHRKQEHGS